MAELNEIRDDFIKELNNWFDMAYAYRTVTNFGISHIHQDIINAKQEKREVKLSHAEVIPTVSSGELDFKVLHQMEVTEALIKVSFNDTDAIEKLYFSRAIQIWYDFLNRIIKNLVEAHFSGKKSYPKLNRFQEITINFQDITQENFIEKITLAVKNSFDFSKGFEKLTILEKALDIKVPQDLKVQIKKFIIVRNLVEHHQATIRQKDLDEMGSNNIKLYDGFGKEQEYKVNDEIKISICEIFRVKNVLEKVTNVLIPHSS